MGSQCLEGTAPTPPTEPPTTPEPEPEPEPEPMSCEDLPVRMNLTHAGQQCNSCTEKVDCMLGFISRGYWAIPCAWTECGCIADGSYLFECPRPILPSPTSSPTPPAPYAAQSEGKWNDWKCKQKCEVVGNCHEKCSNRCNDNCKCNANRRLQSVVV